MPKLSHRAALVLAVVIPFAAVSPSSAYAASPTPELSPSTGAITLTAETQPVLKRPTLDRLSKEARSKGITLKQALDRYAAEVIAKNPSTQRDMPDGPVPDPTIDVDGIPFARLIDLNRIAEAEGISFEESIDRHAWSPRLYPIADSLRSRFPDDLAGLKITDDGRGAFIAFKGQIPPEAVSLAKQLPVEVVLVGNKGFSEKELEQLAKSRYDALTGHPEVALAEATTDFETGAVTLTAELKKEVAANRAALQATLQPEPSPNDKINLSLNIVDSIGYEPIDDYLRGGGFLEEGSPGTTRCTSAFNAISTSGERNAVTARHCSRPLYFWYRNHPDYYTKGTTLGRTGNGDPYDLARYGGGSLTYTRTFYYDLNTPRYVREIMNAPSVNQRICSFGRTTAGADRPAQCGKVVRLLAQSIAGPRAIVTDYLMREGDSGGPGYFDSIAIGVNSGIYADRGETLLSSVKGYSSADGFGTSWKVWSCPTC
ncbi:S1 family peptidase [Nonomuraea sp. B1E8]|uniref:S1 family peptidase n=1 Tax=unclassified Nonomuraea TaxID=2593643 RepID=UPI00325D92BF